MDVRELYKRKLISVEEAVNMVQSNQKVCTAMAASEPQGLLKGLERRKDELENVSLVSCLMMGDYEILKPEMKGRFLNETWFTGLGTGPTIPRNVTYIPNNPHEAGRKSWPTTRSTFSGVRHHPWTRGLLSLSLGLTYEKMMVEAADK